MGLTEHFVMTVVIMTGARVDDARVLHAVIVV